MAAGGGKPRKLTGGNNLTPTWSPSGRALAYIRLRGETGGGALMVQDRTQGKPLELTGRGVTQLAWSPDGEHILYTRTTDADGDDALDPDRDASVVHVLNLTSGEDRRLAEGFDPSWAPRGDRVLISSPGTLVDGLPRRNELRLLDLSGKTLRTVARTSDVPDDLSQFGVPFLANTRLLRHGVVGPDGETVAFSALGGTGVLGTISLSGGAVQVQDILVESGFGRITWASNGTRIAYEVPSPSGVEGVTVLDVATGNRSEKGAGRSEIGYRHPAWSPDGGSLVLVEVRPEGAVTALVTAEPEGTATKRLVTGQVAFPAWSP